MTLLAALRDFCREQGLERTYWVAYSGGVDSHVLLSLCLALRSELNLRLRVIHINHGLSPHAKAWAAHCARVCQQYAVDYVEETVTLDLQHGVEEAARHARYAAFARHLAQHDILLTAHHEEDQAETILLQLLRGAGLKGLAAMPVKKAFASGFHGRPLLSFTRAAIEDYAKAADLTWIEDESNEAVRFTRNFIRHEMIARLKTRWPTVTQTLSRSASHCAEALQLLDEFAKEACRQAQGSQENTLSVQKLLLLDTKKQRLVLRAWIQLHHYPLPNTKKLYAIQSQMLQAAVDRLPCITWQQVEMRRYRDDLYLMESKAHPDTEQVIAWAATKTPLEIGMGLLRAEKTKGRGLRANIPSLTIRFRQSGESVTLHGRGRHTLKNLFQEWGVPPWERARVPLIFSEQTLIGALGYFLDDAYAAKEDEMGWELKR